MTEPEALDAGELPDELGPELGPDGEPFEELDLNGCNDWTCEP